MKNKLRKWVLAYCPFIFGFCFAIISNQLHKLITEKGCSNFKFQAKSYPQLHSPIIEDEAVIYQTLTIANETDKNVDAYADGQVATNELENVEGSNSKSVQFRFMVRLFFLPIHNTTHNNLFFSL